MVILRSKTIIRKINDMVTFMKLRRTCLRNNKTKDNKKIKLAKMQIIPILTFTISVYNTKTTNHRLFYKNRGNKTTKANYTSDKTPCWMNNYKTNCSKFPNLKSPNLYQWNKITKIRITKQTQFSEKRAFLWK